MAKGKTSSKNKTAKFAAYKIEQRWAKNRRAKLEKLAKVHPKNLQITEALANIKYRRKTPKAPHWNPTDVAYAKLFKAVEGKFKASELLKERVMFTGNPKATTSPHKENKDPKGFYSLATRAHDKEGNSVWSQQ